MWPWLLIQLSSGPALNIPNMTWARGVKVTPASFAADVQVSSPSIAIRVKVT